VIVPGVVEQDEFTKAGGTYFRVQRIDRSATQEDIRIDTKPFYYDWGEDIHVENMRDMPGWTSDNYWKPVVIRGVLEKAVLPRLDQVSKKRNRDLKEYFIVREASWEPLPALLAPERPMPDVPPDDVDDDGGE